MLRRRAERSAAEIAGSPAERTTFPDPGSTSGTARAARPESRIAGSRPALHGTAAQPSEEPTGSEGSTGHNREVRPAGMSPRCVRDRHMDAAAVRLLKGPNLEQSPERQRQADNSGATHRDNQCDQPRAGARSSRDHELDVARSEDHADYCPASRTSGQRARRRIVDWDEFHEVLERTPATSAAVT